jgi:hypothetical protein
MNFSKFIVDRRSPLSGRFSEEAEGIPDAAPDDRPLKPKQLFIAGNGGVYKRKADGTNKEVMLPSHIPADDPKHSADDRTKRQTLIRLKLLIQMRDLAREVIETYRTEKTGIVTPYSLRGDKAWAGAQAKLLQTYKSFVWDFGPIHRTELKATGDMDFDGERKTKLTRPNLKKFKKDPEAGVLEYVERFDEAAQTAALGPIFSNDLDWVLTLGAEPEEKLISAAQAPDPALV